mmetsp:Transcript_14906/g.42166  ORF Transcript_14906/g.42166 Transcript_14906/m.42166 type:complete len:234 (-) Transcript_14906:108-809(-)
MFYNPNTTACTCTSALPTMTATIGTIGTLADHTAAVRLLGLLVEHFGLRREVVGSLHQAVQLGPALQHRVDGLVKNLRGLVEVLLNFGDFVRGRRVLVFDKVLVHFREWHGLRLRHCSPCVSLLLREVVQQLSQQDEGNSGWVLEVGGDGAGQAVRSDVAMDDVSLVGDGLALSWLRPLGEGLCEECEHFFDGGPLEETKRRQVCRQRHWDGIWNVIARPDDRNCKYFDHCVL